MFPDAFVGIAVRRIWREVEQPQFSVQGFDESPGLLRDVGGASDEVNEVIYKTEVDGPN